MIEPWVTPWSRFVYTNFHHEPFEPTSPSWELDPGRPLSAANGALPWIVFERDRQMFDRQFPTLHIVSLDPLMPLRYLLSGGVSIRSAVPPGAFRSGVTSTSCWCRRRLGLRCSPASWSGGISMTRPPEPDHNRLERERRHDRHLIDVGVESSWGWTTPAGRRRAASRARLIAAAAGLGPGASVLEIGCGTGIFTEAFARTGARILAVDVSEELLTLARARSLPADRVVFLCDDVESMRLTRAFRRRGRLFRPPSLAARSRVSPVVRCRAARRLDRVRRAEHAEPAGVPRAPRARLVSLRIARRDGIRPVARRPSIAGGGVLGCGRDAVRLASPSNVATADAGRRIGRRRS